MITFQIDDRLILRQFRETDAESVYQTVRQNHEHLREYIHWMVPDYSLRSAKEFIARSISSAEKGESLGFGIFKGDEFIGSIGYVNFDNNSRRTEIGYWISKTEERNGVITRACRMLIDHAFDSLNLNRIEIRCSAENKPGLRDRRFSSYFLPLRSFRLCVKPLFPTQRR